ncbi:hypothetical protein [Gynuella sunshinyii]|uniref:hypothetical protein n=1 Tax=Gynuella sunshinyii TaxID=1445505 RepID=UPI0005CC8A09|nr:hypothetical protein [Gynuella sunshinyii]
MKNKIAVMMIWSLTNVAMANDFIGKWQVTKVDMPDTYYGEIKYPKYFEIIENEGKVSGYYKDQYDFECNFVLSELVNDGNELLLMNCGTTKFAQTWAPLHKVKFINGELVGSVVTFGQVFVWHASAVKNLPLKNH